MTELPEELESVNLSKTSKEALNNVIDVIANLPKKQITIAVMQGYDGRAMYRAYIEGDVSKSASGVSRYEAIGKLVADNPEIFGIKLVGD